MNEFRFCPQCATPLELLPSLEDGGWKERLRCTACGFTHWNNPTPVLAAIVEYQGQVLLARNAAWPPKMFGLITGFTGSTWVRRFTPLIAPGASVLDLACGQGRHMRWLAEQGFRMTGARAGRQRNQPSRGEIRQPDMPTHRATRLSPRTWPAGPWPRVSRSCGPVGR